MHLRVYAITHGFKQKMGMILSNGSRNKSKLVCFVLSWILVGSNSIYNVKYYSIYANKFLQWNSGYSWLFLSFVGSNGTCMFESSPFEGYVYSRRRMECHLQ